MKFGRHLAMSAIVTVFASACSSSEGASDAGSSPTAEPSSVAPASDDFVERNVAAPLEAECGSCHSASRAEKGLVLSALNGQNLRERVVNVPAIEADSLVLVKPGDPEGSYLLRKVRGDLDGVACVAGCGVKMPIGRAYPADRLADLEKWIREGAK